MTATGQYFSAVRIIILYTVVLIFQSVDNNLFPVYSKYGFITVFVMAK